MEDLFSYTVENLDIAYHLPYIDEVEEIFSYSPDVVEECEATYNLTEGGLVNETVIKLAEDIYLYKSPTGHLGYIYAVSEDMSFFFTMLCEVGQPYQPYYQKYFDSQGWEIETLEIDQDPYMIDYIKNYLK